jgi:hypothetical protein
VVEKHSFVSGIAGEMGYCTRYQRYQRKEDSLEGVGAVDHLSSRWTIYIEHRGNDEAIGTASYRGPDSIHDNAETISFP